MSLEELEKAEQEAWQKYQEILHRAARRNCAWLVLHRQFKAEKLKVVMRASIEAEKGGAS